MQVQVLLNAIPDDLTQLIFLADGQLHQNYLLKHDSGTYLLKKISSDVGYYLKNNLQNAHQITKHYANKIPLRLALENHLGEIIFHHQDHEWQIFPYFPATDFQKIELTSKHIHSVVSVLGKIHQSSPSFPAFDTQLSDHFYHLALDLLSQDIFKLKEFNEYLYLFENIITDYQEIAPQLKTNLILAHGDLDKRNCLLLENNHIMMIDWELARYLNQSADVIMTAICWSINHEGLIDQAILNSFLKTYQTHFTNLDLSLFKASLLNLLIDWMAWLNLLTQRFKKDSNVKNSILNTMAVIKNLYQQRDLKIT